MPCPHMVPLKDPSLCRTARRVAALGHRAGRDRAVHVGVATRLPHERAAQIIEVILGVSDASRACCRPDRGSPSTSPAAARRRRQRRWLQATTPAEQQVKLPSTAHRVKGSRGPQPRHPPAWPLRLPRGFFYRTAARRYVVAVLDHAAKAGPSSNPRQASSRRRTISRRPRRRGRPRGADLGATAAPPAGRGSVCVCAARAGPGFDAPAPLRRAIAARRTPGTGSSSFQGHRVRRPTKELGSSL